MARSVRSHQHPKWILHNVFSQRRKDGDKGAEIPSEVTENLLLASKLSIDELVHRWHSRPEGLSKREAIVRLQKSGFNEVISEKPPTWYGTLFLNFTNPFVLLLLALGLISYALGDINALIIITLMVFLGVFMRFIQEWRSNCAATKLRALVSTKATVCRKGAENEEISFKFLVPGDVITLSAGDMIPADIRLIEAHDLFIGQSSLTGESFPVEKFTEGNESDLVHLKNICLLGTNVISGFGKGLVIATGSSTYFGSVAKAIVARRPLTSFDIGVNKVSFLLVRIMFVMAPVVFLINGLSKGTWFEALLFALSVAVGLTPEMLPMIVTANLAKGALNMSKSKVIVKHLNSIQNFGAMNVLCTDKTGTLTQDKVVLEEYLDLEGKVNKEILKFAFLNSFYEAGLKNLLDKAILEHTECKEALKLYQKVDEIPFDFSRKRMSVVVKAGGGEKLLICKGSYDAILSITKNVRWGGSDTPVNETHMLAIRALHDQLNNKGLRVLALGVKTLSDDKVNYHIEDETDLTLLGFLVFLDPPKQTAAEAVKLLQKAGIEIKVLTGDDLLITKRICEWVGLKAEKAITGEELSKISEENLIKVAKETTIFAKLTPLQKSQIIAAIKKSGNTVGYLGDGINDAPALREADIGISVDSAVDIAKESSDIIMLEKNLLFLEKGAFEGRRTFANILKYIKMATSSNFGNVFSMIGASLLLPFLPMLPLQLLLQNLLYDISQLAIPFDSVDCDYLESPRSWTASGIGRFMLLIGPISSVFDYTTFAFLWFFFHANSAFFQTGWFVEGLLSQTLIVHMIRTAKIPFIQSLPSLALLTTTLFVMTLGVVIPYTSLGRDIGMVKLPLAYYFFLLPTLFSYCLLTQIVKFWFIRRFKSWL